MSGRGRRKAEARRARWWESLRLGGLLQVALAAYLGLSLLGPRTPWWAALDGGPLPAPAGGANPGGPIGALVALTARVVWGAAWAWLLPVLLGLAGLAALAGRRGPAGALVRRLWPLWLFSCAWLAQPGGPLPAPAATAWGGLPGLWLGRGFHALFGVWGARIFLTFLLLAALAWAAGRWLGPLGRAVAAVGAALARTGRALAAAAGGLAGAARAAGAGLVWLARGIGRGLGRAPGAVAGLFGGGEAEAEAEEAGSRAARAPARQRRLHGVPTAAAPRDGAPAAATSAAPTAAGAGAAAPAEAAGGAAPGGAAAPARAARRAPVAWTLPPVDLLRAPDPEADGMTPAALDAAADRLEDTLRSFGVQGEVKDVRPGPVVTTFEYQPASGVRVSQITQRANDLALAMRARSLRMEAPIPGKAAVGIEIPNPRPRVVRLREVLAAVGPRARGPLAVALGADVVGQPIGIDLAGLPHLLVAGSTGSGKSVCLNTIICNLLLRNDPSRVRLLLIDPKMLEMSVYNGLPHLLLPVVTDPREALKSLKWMVEQMDRRYRRLARAGVRNIDAYNERVARGQVRDAEGEPVTEPMPYYVTIVDELADLMIQLGQEFEQPITRLAAKARAVGIHLILATQRPSVDVLTGVIKANIPCRIAFRVIQRNDSRTILDMNGAESLLGHGDLLYLQPGRAVPVRVQCALIELEECEAIVAHWRQYEDLAEPVSLEDDSESGGSYTGEDDLFEEARRVVVLHQSGSTSLLQRRLRVGYTRAGRLMDMLEEAGVVGPFTGSKAREVLIRPEELETDPLADEEEA